MTTALAAALAAGAGAVSGVVAMILAYRTRNQEREDHHPGEQRLFKPGHLKKSDRHLVDH